MASIVAGAPPPCSKTSGAEQVHTGFGAGKKAVAALRDLKVSRKPAAALMGADLAAQREKPVAKSQGAPGTSAWQGPRAVQDAGNAVAVGE